MRARGAFLAAVLRFFAAVLALAAFRLRVTFVRGYERLRVGRALVLTISS